MATVLRIATSVDISSKTKVVSTCCGDGYKFSFGASLVGGASLAKVICHSCWGRYSYSEVFKQNEVNDAPLPFPSFPMVSPPVFKAVTTARIAVLQGTEINAEVRHGRNALHYAADAGKVPIVRFLLENMAIIDVRDWVFFLFFFPFFVYFCVCK